MNVLDVPKTKYCLISGAKIDQAGGGISYENGSCKFWNSKGKIIATGKIIGNLYCMNIRAQLGHVPEVNLASRTSELSWHEAHKRLGHISLSSLSDMISKGTVDGIKILENETRPEELNCESCIVA